ncbi:GNAT family N-acetyltransferase [Defluviimonas sp. WL0002]|uniref:GNAT family N-acetyltransferase n=1 Tax=Albidovulum marisflavi TaxID=2984159 RepID=A0ABT2ZAN3_9RHOB|nr:GNAT family N-acetyltransferase [Defluviimonas sp. WL0002]MCV2868182.1 GNAT family N-acetyltransferase [Defluviimonas sp. WL0002]
MAAAPAKGVRIASHSPAEPGWRDRMKAHLLGLGPDARLNRFFTWVSDAHLERYAATSRPEVVFDAVENGVIVGVAELYRWPDVSGEGEIAVSVNEGHRRSGIGQALIDAALKEGRRRGFADVHLYFRKANAAMQRIAARSGLEPLDSGDPNIAEVHARFGKTPLWRRLLRLGGHPSG